MSDCSKCKHLGPFTGYADSCLWVENTFPPPVLRAWCLPLRVVIEIEPANCPAFEEKEKL